MKRLQRGFSLVEILVASALLSGLVLMFMRFTDQMTQLEGRMLNTLEITDMHQALKLRVNDPLVCSVNFTPQKPNDVVPLSRTITVLRDTYGKAIAEVGKRYGRVEVVSMLSRPAAGEFPMAMFENLSGQIDLVIEYKGQGKDAPRLTRTIPIIVSAKRSGSGDAGSIVGCGTPYQAIVDEVSQNVMIRMCNTIGQPYNKLTGQCDATHMSKDKIDALSTIKVNPELIKELVRQLTPPN